MGVFMFFIFDGNLLMSFSEGLYATGDAGTMGCNPHLVQKQGC
jgi:hypothetical protein